MSYEYRPGPKHPRQRDDYIAFAQHLIDNPGVWVKMRTAPTWKTAGTAAYKVRNGQLKAFQPAGAFDAYSTGREVIARYIGEDK